MDPFTNDVLARRAGATDEEVARFIALGILAEHDGGFTDADVRVVRVLQMLERSGLPLDGIATLLRAGRFDFGFVEQVGYEVFSSLADVTFADVSERTGIPVEHLLALRDVTGGRAARPADLVRQDELAILPLVEYQVELGFRWPAIERALRVYGDSLRRIAEAEAEWWRSEVQEPMLRAGVPARELAVRAGEVSPRLSQDSDRALMAIYHAQQMQVWSTNIVTGIAAALEQAGLHRRQEQAPAVCFLDLAGYTQLTAEQGDAAAVGIVERVSRIVQRVAVDHGGRPVKWLGDGVMSHFPDPGLGVLAALEMVRSLAVADLPAAHVGLHAGPVVIQEGDYYGQTVNVASRIGEYARPGEVLVSREVVDAARDAAVVFRPIGAVALKGVRDPMDLYSAERDA